MATLVPYLLLFIIGLSGQVYSQIDPSSLKEINLSKDYWQIYYCDSIPRKIGEVLYTGYDTSVYNEGGSELKVVEKFQEGYKTEVKTFYENGSPCEFYEFKNGKRHGVSRKWYRNGNIMFDNVMENGKQKGVSLSYFESGTPQYLTDESSELFMEWYANGKMKQRSKRLFIDTLTCEEITEWNSEGQLGLKSISNCGKQKFFAYFNDSTTAIEGTIIDMPLFWVGKYTMYYKNGNKKHEAFYTDSNTQREANYRIGTWSWWDEQGNIIRQEIYNNNELIDTKEFFPKKLKGIEK